MTATNDTSHPNPDASPADGASTRRAPGRPRLNPTTREGVSTRDEILEVAAKLFTEQGYTDTTTRQIAQAVGIKQASLYYHFADKNSILGSLLTGTVEPAVRFADWLDNQDLDPAIRLYTLARFDLEVILRDRWNLHVLYRLPDASPGDHGNELQTILRQRYMQFAHSAAAAGTDPDAVRDDLELVFGLVESILVQRDWGDTAARHAYADSVARGCLRLVRAPESIVGVAEPSARAIIDRYTAQASAPLG